MGCWEICFMSNSIVETAKRLSILGAFFAAAAWLVWCGESYNDQHNSTLPVIMCAVTSIVLVITGAAIAGRKIEPHFDGQFEGQIG